MDPRHASSSLSKWGLVQGWLVGSSGRRVELRASSTGLMATVFDPTKGEKSADIGMDEEPSSVIWRTVIALDRGR